MRLKHFSAGALSLALALPGAAFERLEPAEGCYFGFSLDSGRSISVLGSTLGFTPAVYVRFFPFPGISQESENIRGFLEEVARAQGIAMLTLEPWDGLERVNENECLQLASLCRTFEAQSIGGIIVRFGHEMNGNWYPWGQKPALFKEKFRLLAGSLREETTRTAMMWAPSYGVGYPFGTAVPAAGSADFQELDTDGNRIITDRDDMYEPYYPGNDVVDWVGITLYHWGNDFPWLENEIPPENSFAKALVGAYQGSIPNFYARYCLDPARKKPMAITETAAFYNTEMPGPSEFRIKQAWWTQIFDTAPQFPMLKCINWFDEYKRESVARNNLIDWRVSANSEIRAAFVGDLRSVGGERPYFLTAEDTKRLLPFYISANSLPHILPVAGTINVSLEVKTAGPCDLVIDLLDEGFQWQGGTRVPLTPPGGMVSTSFQLNQPLTDRTSYRWSIFLTPRGADYLSAIAWYNGPNPSDDPDGDGSPNREELIAGTSPRDASDVLALSVQRRGTNVVVSWNSKTGHSYRLFSTLDLENWSVAGEPILGTGQRISISQRQGSMRPATLYRVTVTRP